MQILQWISVKYFGLRGRNLVRYCVLTSFTLQNQRVPCVTVAHDYSAARTCAVQETRQLEGTHGPDKAKQQQRIV